MAYARETAGEDAVGEIVGAIPGLCAVHLNKSVLYVVDLGRFVSVHLLPLKDLEGTASDIASLKASGIRTTARLLEAAQDAERPQASVRENRDRPEAHPGWANMADQMRVKGLGKEYAELLRVAGVDTVKELKYRNPGKLAQAMAAANKKRKLVRLVPTEKAIGRWIEEAKKLPLKITY